MSTPASVSSSASPSPSSASAEAPASAASGVDTGSFPVVDLAALPNPMAHVRAVSVVPLHFAEPRKPVRFEDGWDYYRRIGSPKTVCAPMVNQSELAFRLLCRRYATDVCYTPMFHAEIFGKDASYRADAMQLPPVPSADRPLVAQFCGNNPQLILKAARHVEHLVDAVDINLGCPQGIAKRGNYGSFLLEEYQLLHDIVSTLHQHLSIPVTCKIRRLKTDEATVALVRMLQEAGAALITIHGRTRHQLKDKVGACDFDIIRLVKQNCSVPVFANGGIYDLSDVQRCLAYTGVDGVMSSEALLCNPSIFSGKRVDSIEIAKEYMTIVREIESTAPTEQSMIRAHLFKMLYQHLGLFHDLRDKLAHCDPADFDAVIAEIEARFEGKTAQEKQAMLDTVPLWYHRHIQTPAQKAAAEEKARLKKKQQEEDAAAARDDEADGLDAFNLFEECDNDGCGNQQQCS